MNRYDPSVPPWRDGSGYNRSRPPPPPPYPSRRQDFGRGRGAPPPPGVNASSMPLRPNHPQQIYPPGTDQEVSYHPPRHPPPPLRRGRSPPGGQGHQMYRFGQGNPAGDASIPPPPPSFSFTSSRSMPPPPRAGNQRQNQGRRPKRSFAEAMESAQREGQVKARRLNNGRDRPWVKRQPQAMSDRPLLRHGRAATPERMEGMSKEPARFRSLDDLSDTEVEEMNLESSGSAETDSEGEREQKKVDIAKDLDKIEAQAAPRWSNPDPYATLPPPDESRGKKKDVIKLIQKARASISKPDLSAAMNHDFISFDSDEDRDSDYTQTPEASDSDQASPIEPNAPKSSGPRGSSYGSTRARRSRPGNSSSRNGSPMSVESQTSTLRRKDQKNFRPASYYGDQAVTKYFPDDVSRSWRASVERSLSCTPWLLSEKPSIDHINERLENEILQFYDYVRPREFESSARKRLVNQTQDFIDYHIRRGRHLSASARYKVSSFGSFAAGTYLPDADMDLVILSDAYQRSGRPEILPNSGFLHWFAHQLQIARFGVSPKVIPKAKVPLIKYTDAETGLRVDLSFENDSGVAANDLYQEWIQKYPGMSVIVLIIKQLLVMRDLNDVSIGGLGSFSITCMVVSFMESTPHSQAPSDSGDDWRKNVAEILMAFLNFYGNNFDINTMGIKLHPPSYFPKGDGKVGRLTIVDPNDPDNDISKGSSRIRQVLDVFAKAHGALAQRMREVREGTLGAGYHSILAPVFAGNYQSFEKQRARLRDLGHGR